MFDYRLRFLREKAGMKSKDIAEVLEISNSRYGHYENEKDTIPIKYLIILANYHNVSLDYLFGFSKNMNYKNNSSEPNFKLSSERIKELRKEQNLKQIELASILKCCNSLICNIEKGKNILSTSLLYSLCQKYKVSADYLLGKIDMPKFLK